MCESFPETVFYEDFHKMLDEAKLDVLLVETGADVHAQFCADGLSRNINVMSDIPVVANLEEADMLWEVAKKSKAMFSTGANPNEAKFSVMLKDLYQRGFLGKPYCMEAEYIHWSKGGAASKFLTENGNWRKLLCPIRYCTHSLGPLLAVMEELRLSKEECVYIGDSDTDILTAKNAGIDPISVSWGFRTEDFLKSHGAEKIVNKVEDLLRI